MPPLQNEQRERFCRRFVETGLKRQSAIDAGYSAKSAHTQAGYLMKVPEVQNRVKELKSEVADAVIQSLDERIPLDRVISDLSKIAITGMSNFITIQENGEAFVDLSTATKDQLDALQEVYCETVIEKDGEETIRVRKIKIKGYDRLKAYDMLMKHLGGYLVDRAKAVEADALQQLVREISRRGSKPHVIEQDGG